MQRAYHFKYKSNNYRFGVVTFIASSLYNANQLWWRFCEKVTDDVIFMLSDTYVSQVKDTYTYDFRTKYYTNHVVAANYIDAWKHIVDIGEDDRVYDVEGVN